jgi:hypothetical protein
MLFHTRTMLARQPRTRLDGMSRTGGGYVRGMRVPAILIASLVLTLIATAPAAAAKSSCARKGSKTVARTPEMRVYTVRSVDRVAEEEVVRLYGCWSADGSKRWLAENVESDYDGSGSGFGDVRAAGRYVAWLAWDFDGSCKADCPPGYDQSNEAMVVYDLRRGRVLRRSDLPDHTTYRSGSLALTQRGGIAWLTSAETLGSAPDLAALDRDGRRVLDSGNIEPASVRAEISIVSWVRDGVEHFARLR